ncbi:MAG TPA: hypothetical protein VJC16_06670 [Candidatus Nanoarchaeia archaeon]|nr:hypothetical protein [Candidatus Nanoarchaeia archaeon]
MSRTAGQGGERLRLLQAHRQRLMMTLSQLEQKYRAGLMDTESCKALANSCMSEIQACDEQIYKLNTGKSAIAYIGGILLIVALIGSLFFFRPAITGYFVKEPLETSTDGYRIEGQRWADIKGGGIYERCLLVSSGIDFSEAALTAKATVADQDEQLRMRMYTLDQDTQDPGYEIGSCSVEDYSTPWKSCTITGLARQPAGDYWICAYAEGSKEKTYYTIAHNPEGTRIRAFWTGKYWQKLENASYTIKAEFRRW